MKRKMNETDFKAMCYRASEVLGVEALDGLGEYGRIEIDGMDIAVFFNEDLAPDRIFCYLDLGPVKDAGRSEACENLMMLNFLVGTRTDGVFGMDPASGNVLMIVHVLASETLTGDLFAQALQFYAAQAASVRKSLIEEPLPEFNLQEALEAQFGRVPDAAPSA